MSESSFISIGERAYRYIRQFTIKSVQDALIELITNCVDAYNKTSFIERRIDIDMYSNTVVFVRDRAIGLTSDGLQKCFLQIGDFTANDTSRGFFSRGAKDISALGNLTFSTIKDNVFSQCILNTDAYGKITVYDIPATDALRETHKIPSPFNGLEVKIDLLSNFYTNNENLYRSLNKLVVLRDIISNTTNNYIYFNEFDSMGNLISSRRVTYEYPSGDLLLEMQYNVPGYELATATLVVYKAHNRIPQPASESELEFGFLIKDNSSVYEASTVQERFRWNPYMNTLFGYIKCDYIHKLLIEYDSLGPSQSNPYPIIDPSRLTGVNKLHPFIINMLSIPALRVDQILRELNKSLSTSSVSITDIDDLLNELQKYGLDIIEKEDIEVSFVPSYDSNLAKAIADERANFVTYEKSYVLSDMNDVQQTSLNEYIKSEIIRLYPNYDESKMFVYNPVNNLVQLLNMDKSEFNNVEIDILEIIPQENVEALTKHPYVYNLSKDGSLSKLYIFNKGIFSDTDSSYDKLVIKNKQFKIEFIDDINIEKRYIIDNTNGITIQINLHNPIVSRYLRTPVLENSVDLQNISSTKSIVFLKELITDVLTDIILENDINKSKITLDSSSTYINAKRILDYRNDIIVHIEMSINNMFDRIINENKNKKLNTITSIINIISSTVGSQMEVSEDLSNMKNTLINTLLTTLE